MSTMHNPRLSEEARFELSLAAAAKERRNRPLWMVIAAALLVLIVAVAALAGVLARRSAVNQLEKRLQDVAAVEHMAAQYRALGQVASQSGDQQIGEPLADFRTRLETLATASGFATAPSPRELERQNPHPGIVVRRFAYFDVREQSLGTILEWLRRATQDRNSRIRGLEIESLRLRPDNNQWTFSVTLRRWERAS